MTLKRRIVEVFGGEGLPSHGRNLGWGSFATGRQCWCPRVIHREAVGFQVDPSKLVWFFGMQVFLRDDHGQPPLNHSQRCLKDHEWKKYWKLNTSYDIMNCLQSSFWKGNNHLKKVNTAHVDQGYACSLMYSRVTWNELFDTIIYGIHDSFLPWCWFSSINLHPKISSRLTTKNAKRTEMTLKCYSTKVELDNLKSLAQEVCELGMDGNTCWCCSSGDHWVGDD